MLKLTLSSAEVAPTDQKEASGIKHLNLVVAESSVSGHHGARLGHVRFAACGHCDGLGFRQSVVFSGTKTDRRLEPSSGIEHLYTIVFPIGHVDLICSVRGNAVRKIELSVFPTKSTPFPEEATLEIEYLHAVIVPGGHVHPIVLPHRDTNGRVELTIIATLEPPCAQDVEPSSFWRHGR